MNTYNIDYKCCNCNSEGQAQIPKGTLVPDTFKCPNCGCKTAHKPYHGPKPVPWLPTKKRTIPYYPPERWVEIEYVPYDPSTTTFPIQLLKSSDITQKNEPNKTLCPWVTQNGYVSCPDHCNKRHNKNLESKEIKYGPIAC